MSFWEQVVATVLGGVVVALLLALGGWIWAIARKSWKRRPAFVVYKDRTGSWYLERTARKTAYQVRIFLGLKGSSVLPNGQPIVPFEDTMERGQRTAIQQTAQHYEWDEITVHWRTTPVLIGETFLREGVERAEIMTERNPHPLRARLRRLLN